MNSKVVEKKKLMGLGGIAAIMLGLGAVALASCNGASFDSSKSITVVTREDGSGTKSAFMEILGLKGKADVDGCVTQTSTSAVLEEVSGNSYAIAYDSLGYVTDAVKILTVDGVEATTENIASGAYTISRPLNVIYKEATISGSTLYTAYLNYLKSSEAQQMISDSGYVSILDGATSYVADSSLSGSIAISGSTSLQPLMTTIASAFMAVQPNVTVEVSGGGSGTGYKNADGDVSVFGMISEEYDSSKVENTLSYYTVAKDGIAAIVNLKNPLNDISFSDLSTIYNSEAESPITSWSQLIDAE